METSLEPHDTSAAKACELEDRRVQNCWPTQIGEKKTVFGRPGGDSLLPAEDSGPRNGSPSLAPRSLHMCNEHIMPQ